MSSIFGLFSILRCWQLATRALLKPADFRSQNSRKPWWLLFRNQVTNLSKYCNKCNLVHSPNVTQAYCDNWNWLRVVFCECSYLSNLCYCTEASHRAEQISAVLVTSHALCLSQHRFFLFVTLARLDWSSIFIIKSYWLITIYKRPLSSACLFKALVCSRYIHGRYNEV